ncbi:peptidoglycan DD-metalloendopeptidase family protein [Nocardioides cynanchi]|uniref:peptidoglycan DD-metalloendopeptidase family protein n=1 Tax=Nocardioides cynanchi TaxID=2558918 RepID=UPI0012460AED|nr:M23 family metallopeptidase [Nocardioides cynanchi]
MSVPLSTPWAPWASADVKHLRHQQSQAQHSVKHAQASLEESSRRTRVAYDALARSRADLRTARADLQAARTHVRAARARLHQVQRQLDRARARLQDARTHLAEGKQAMTDQHAQLVSTVTSLYEQGDPQLVGFLSLMNATSPADLSAKSANNSLVLGSQDHALDSLTATKVLLQVRETEMTKATALVAKKKGQAHDNLVLERGYKQQALAARIRVQRSVRHRAHALAEARRAHAHDRAVLARSRAREARVHRALMAEIARERARGGGYRGPTGGILLRPVNGPITSPYGYRINPVMGYYGLHDGVDFGAACGTPIWAAGDATVLSEYYSSVWGNRLFLNLGLVNGKNVTVIYNHLSAYRSTVGEHVGRGQVVGLIGTTGWSTGCHTHMTVMVNGVAVNPAPWLG